VNTEESFMKVSLDMQNSVVDPLCVPRPYPGRTEPLPKGRFTPTGEWFTKLLGNKYPGIAAHRFEILRVLDSHTTKVVVKVAWNDVGVQNGLPDELVIKTNWSGDFDNVDICALEARFYHFLADKSSIATAKCYYADWDDSGSGEGIIVLENLDKLGGHFAHSLDEHTLDSLEKAVRDCARFHGALWNSPLIQPEAAPWLPTSMDVPVDYDQLRIMWRWLPTNLADPNFRAVAPKHFLDDPTRLIVAFDNLATYERAFASPYCLILGDCHQGNTYVLPSGDRLWLDFQLVRRGRPWRDLSYFLIGMMSVEDRRQHHRDLLAIYREELIGTGADNVISLDEIWEQTRHWAIYGVQAWVVNIDSWGQNGLPMNERFFSAAEDYDSWRLLGV
jgi:hypothetical protein